MTGLSSLQVLQKRDTFGLNILKSVNSNPWWSMLLSQFTDLLILILIASAAIAIFLGFYEGNREGILDGVIILVIVLLNAGIGFYQEFKTDKALEALKKMISPFAMVIRNGERCQVKAEDIVPGDLIILSAGDKIVADGNLIESSELKADEAPLTGESVPVHKSKDDKVFMGTTVVAGSGIMEVTATGMRTEFGKIAHLTTKTVQDKSPLQKEMAHIGVFVTQVVLTLCAILTIISIFSQGRTFLDALLFSVSVAVAAVPEGLPATITVALTLGVQKMARRNVVVKRLSSIETLGSTTVICSDKTGTLTKNEMTVTRLLLGINEIVSVSGAGYNPEDGCIEKNTNHENLQWIRNISQFCTEAVLQKKEGRYQVLGDPTEGALLALASKKTFGQKKSPEILDLKIHDKIPFDSERKLMSVIGADMILTKGSPDELLKRCTQYLENGHVKALPNELKKEIQLINESFANDALRVIGFAYSRLKKNIENDLVFVGLAGMIDPPREEVSNAVSYCYQAGIRTIIITGDHGLTAKSIAKNIGMATDKTRVIMGDELEQMKEKDLDEILRATPKYTLIFSRVTPEHKRRVVDRLKNMGEIVAVTGDGVNDAPALKRADLGIAMGITGTEVSKETANMILLDDSFASIILAVKEGRKIYSNLKKFTWFIFSTNIAELVTVFSAILLTLPSPLTAVLILAVNLGTDVLPAIALGVDHSEPDVMRKPPRNSTARIMNKRFVTHFVVMGILMGALVIALFYWKLSSLGWSYGQVLDISDPIHTEATSFAFTLLVMIQLFNAYNSRSFTHSIFKLRSLWQLWGANILSVILVLLMLYVPALQEVFHTKALSGSDWLIIVGVGLVVIFVEEMRKVFLKPIS